MPSLEKKLDELMAMQKPSTVQVAKVLQPYLKNVEDWPKTLRRLADYIEQRPRPIMISAGEVGALVRLALREGTD